MNDLGPSPSPADQAALDAAYGRLAAAERLLPIKVTAFYQRKIDREVAALGHRNGPLHRVLYPSAERLVLRAPGEVADFVDDHANMAAPDSVIRKYRDRVLFTPTPVCAAHCQYCFRQDLLSEQHGRGRPDLEAKLAALLAYLDAHPEVGEVILSGGDPLSLGTAALARILAALRARPQLGSIRLHSRALVFAPRVFDDPRKIAVLAEAGVRLVFHIVHPYELCAEVTAAIARLTGAGISCYNQFPLLRHINDHVDVIALLLRRLDELKLRNLSIYAVDPVKHSAAYRVSLTRLFALQDALFETTPSWINATAFTFDTPWGKVRREHLVAWDRAAGLATFRRAGRDIPYHDLPAELDRPGDPKVMLWQGASPHP